MSDAADYKTVAALSTDELEEKKSRFIASISPVDDEDQAIAFIASVKAQNRKARHNVYAYLLREGSTCRYSDDGEPQGTGGVPVLETLKKAGLTDVCCVVTRYFGGVLLGTGGLARAYSSACRLAIDAAQIKVMCHCSRLDIACDYSFYGRLSQALPSFGAKTINEDFSDTVKVSVIVKSSAASDFKAQLVDLSNGKIDIKETQNLFEDFA